jgi:predicted transcriptional regulator
MHRSVWTSSPCQPCYPECMEVQLSAEQEAQLAEIATRAGTNPEQLAQDVLVRYLDDEARFFAAVEKGIAAANQGEFIEEEEMDARIERMFNP